jgi:hypothetical protein
MTSPKKNEEKPKYPLKNFYQNQGVAGVLDMAQAAFRMLKKLAGGVCRAFTINQLFVRLSISGKEAADTALRYGKACAAVFPLMGFACANMRVRRYAADVRPDFLGGKTSAAFHVKISVVPIRVTNALVAAVFRLFFQVLLKLLLANRRARGPQHKAIIKKETV